MHAYVNFLSCVNDYIEDMATFTALAKIKFIPPNLSAIQRYLGLQNFYLVKIFTDMVYRHMHTMKEVTVLMVIGQISQLGIQVHPLSQGSYYQQHCSLYVSLYPL